MKQRININLIPSGVVQVIHLSQNDYLNGELEFHVYHGSSVVGEEIINALIKGVKTDNNVFVYNATQISGNVVTFDVKEQMTAAGGKVYCKLRIQTADGAKHSKTFILDCEADPTTGGTASESDIEALEELIESIEGDIVDARTAADEAADYAGQAKSTVVDVRRDIITVQQSVSSIQQDITATQNDVSALQISLNDEISNRQAQDAILSARMDEFTKLPDESLSTAADAELADIRVMSNGKTAATAGNAVREQIATLQNNIDDVSNATVEYKTSKNVHNPDTDVSGVLVYTGKSINSSATGITSNFIPVSAGDTVYYTAISQSGAFLSTSTVTMRWLAWYSDDNMDSVISCNAYQNSAVAPDGANYFRASSADLSRLVHSITLNTYPTSLAEIERYFTPYYRNNAKLTVDDHIIDCWGDSRTAMSNDGTSFTDYLQTLLGDDYNVCNYGITSQSSGNCAMRLGANEVFVSLANNQIPSSGAVALTALHSMASDQFSVYAFSAKATSPCIIGGVRGRLNRSNTGDISQNTFIRDTEGVAVSVRPYTKVCVDNMDSNRHICVFWWGKNDYSKYQGSSPNPQILDNYAAAVRHINHEKFIILGETCSIGDDYLPGGNKRAFLDALNSTLESLYPDNYLNINSWLASEAALTSVGLTATSKDLEYIQNGWPCYQLMVYSTTPSDTVHPNKYGRQAIAHKIHEWLSDKGWV